MAFGDQKKFWVQTAVTAFFAFGVSQVVSVVFPWQTKISKFIGIPFRFYGEGVFPWLGDLENKKVFFTGGLVLDVSFWFLFSGTIVLLYNIVKRRKT